jgi:hypothetical protein
LILGEEADALRQARGSAAGGAHRATNGDYAVKSAAEGSKSWVFSDANATRRFWARVNQLNVSMLVIGTAFSNRERDRWPEKSHHLSPDSLADELECIADGKPTPSTTACQPRLN